jgi:hypothetical protein
MRYWKLVWLKTYREGEFVNIFLMFFVLFFSIYKETFLVFLLIPVFFNDKIFKLLWENDNERMFYIQFSDINLRKVIIIKQFIFFLQFNLISIFSEILVLLIFKSNFNIPNWIILNIYLLINMIFSDVVFNKAVKKKWLKILLLMTVNFILTGFIVFIKYLKIKGLIIFPFILIFLIVLKIYTTNSLKEIKIN